MLKPVFGKRFMEDSPIWVRVGDKVFDLRRWNWEGFRYDHAVAWFKAGFTDPREAAMWRRDWGVNEPEDAAIWRNAGWKSYESKYWWHTGLDPKEAMKWKNAGFAPGIAVTWHNAGWKGDDAPVARKFYWARWEPDRALRWFKAGYRDPEKTGISIGR